MLSSSTCFEVIDMDTPVALQHLQAFLWQRTTQDVLHEMKHNTQEKERVRHILVDTRNRAERRIDKAFHRATIIKSSRPSRRRRSSLPFEIKWRN